MAHSPIAADPSGALNAVARAADAVGDDATASAARDLAQDPATPLKAPLRRGLATALQLINMLTNDQHLEKSAAVALALVHGARAGGRRRGSVDGEAAMQSGAAAQRLSPVQTYIAALTDPALDNADAEALVARMFADRTILAEDQKRIVQEVTGLTGGALRTKAQRREHLTNWLLGREEHKNRFMIWSKRGPLF